MMRCQKTLHDKSLPIEEKRRLQNLQRRDENMDRAMEFRKNMYILRHEQGIGARRARDPYLFMTGAQQDLHQVLPGTATRVNGEWMINNTARQQLCKNGQPIMTRIMHGDFYYQDPPKRPSKLDYVTMNKVHLRAASAAASAKRLGQL
jgi:hypothetical protein